jgi:hypothetical protein
LGSVRANPWVELFEERLNFRFEYDPATGSPLFRNRSSLADEAPLYRAEYGETSKAYAVVSLVDNLSMDGKVLMIAGTGLEGSEAAGEFILDPGTAEQLIRQLGLRSGGRLRNFEILLRTAVVGGTPAKAELIAHRLLGE